MAQKIHAVVQPWAGRGQVSSLRQAGVRCPALGRPGSGVQPWAGRGQMSSLRQAGVRCPVFGRPGSGVQPSARRGQVTSLRQALVRCPAFVRPVVTCYSIPEVIKYSIKVFIQSLERHKKSCKINNNGVDFILKNIPTNCLEMVKAYKIAHSTSSLKNQHPKNVQKKCKITNNCKHRSKII